MLLNVDRGGKEETQGLGVGREKKNKKKRENIAPKWKEYV